MKPQTVTIHGGLEPPPEYGAVSVPIYQTSTFSFTSAEKPPISAPKIFPLMVMSEVGPAVSLKTLARPKPLYQRSIR